MGTIHYIKTERNEKIANYSDKLPPNMNKNTLIAAKASSIEGAKANELMSYIDIIHSFYLHFSKTFGDVMSKEKIRLVNAIIRNTIFDVCLKDIEGNGIDIVDLYLKLIIYSIKSFD